MIISLEYIICQLQQNKISVAIKSHRAKKQNPGLDIQVTGNDVKWDLVGLNAGEVERADPENPSSTRIDFYIGKAQLLNQFHAFPASPVAFSGNTLSPTNPTGSVRRGGKPISWRGHFVKLQIDHASAFFPDGNYMINTQGNTRLNIDWEPAMYPLPDGTRHQLHFGVESDFYAKTNRRRRIHVQH